MLVLVQLVLLILGLIILLKGADFLVDGSSAMAKIFKVPTILIGLTIVSFGTSAPELLTSLTSVVQGSPDISLGNIIGSNITNILLILGIAAIINPLQLKSNTVWKEIPLAILAALAMILFSVRATINSGAYGLLGENLRNRELVVGVIDRADGITLLLFFAVFMYYAFSLSKKGLGEVFEIPKISMRRAAGLVLLGALGLGLGSNLLVDNAISLASALNIDESLVGLTIVAFGTSLPELAATVAAAKKKQADLAVGNVVGSNIFNILFVLGVTTTVQPIEIGARNLIDMLIILVITVVLFVAAHFFGHQRITKTEGYIMLTGYLGYFAYLLY